MSAPALARVGLAAWARCANARLRPRAAPGAAHPTCRAAAPPAAVEAAIVHGAAAVAAANARAVALSREAAASPPQHAAPPAPRSPARRAAAALRHLAVTLIVKLAAVGSTAASAPAALRAADAAAHGAGGGAAGAASAEASDEAAHPASPLTVTPCGVPLYVAHGPQVHSGDPAPVVLLLHQVRAALQNSRAPHVHDDTTARACARADLSR